MSIELHPPIRSPRRNIPCTNPSFRKGPFEAFRECGAVMLEGDPDDYLDLTGDWADNYTHWMLDVFAGAAFLRMATKTRWKAKWRAVLRPEMLGVPFIQDTMQSLGVDPFVTHEDAPLCRVLNPLAYSSLAHPSVIEFWRNEAVYRGIKYQIQPQHLLIQRGIEGTGKTQSRNFTEREAILQTFAKAGIALNVVYLEGTPFWQQVSLFAQAETIIAAHGSALTNLMFCKPSCKVIEVASVSRHNQTYSDIASHLEFPMIVAEGVEKKLHGPDKDYCLDIDPSHLLELYHSL
jgi:capsular polysaccharide biosynthesis protein